jgi:putative colanic acid biosynthesis UDP-glucose lipid carrier transferase
MQNYGYCGVVEGTYEKLKRAEDIVLGAALVVIWAVPMVVIAVAIRLTSGDPVLFRQERGGLNGKPFRIAKFRTMTTSGQITSLGSFLRRWSLDELPQLFQVLSGELSLVGPRPHAIAHDEFYCQKLPEYLLRQRVKPGVTGWAQINGARGNVTTIAQMERRLRFDLEYIRLWSVALDLKIVGLTVARLRAPFDCSSELGERPKPFSSSRGK